MLAVGCEVHIVIALDPLGLGAVRLDSGEWAEAVDKHEHPPKIGERVFVFRFEKIYWFA